MVLIADSGSTKTDWVLLKGNEITHYKTIGYNPYFISTQSIYNSLSADLVCHFDPATVKCVYFYGAGCSNPENVAIVEKALLKCFVNSKLHIGHDMLAAARALLGNKAGFAAIIGTGSNTCIYNGKQIEKNIDSLGYLLGDEGSGSNIGKKIVRDYLRNYLPLELQNKFYGMYRMSQADIFNTLYNQPLPNRFLAGFCKFADDNKDNGHIKAIVKESFNEFFRNLVSRYPNYKQYEFNCIGSVGFIFSDILKEVTSGYNMGIGRIIHNPIENLVEYHLKQL
jgi:glucosamine kinase